MANDNQLSDLERLTKLRDTGALSEEEFAVQKATILGSARSREHVRFYRRLWFVILLTCLIFTFPLAMIILLTGDVYRSKEGTLQPIGKTARLIYGGILALWIAALVVKAIIDPAGTKRDFTEGATTSPATNTAPQTAANGPALPDKCDSSDAAGMVKGALEGNNSALVTVKVLDFGHAQETFFDKTRNVRRCEAEAILNTGDSLVTYQLYFGPSGGELVQVEQGVRAEQQQIIDRDDKSDALKAAAAPAPAQETAPAPDATPTAQDQQTPPATDQQDATTAPKPNDDNAPADNPRSTQH